MTRDPDAPIEVNPKTGRTVIVSTDVKVDRHDTQRPSIVNTSLPTKRRLIDRDGWACFYCGVSMSLREATIEHVQSKNKGGTSQLENLVLAHGRCNGEAGSLPVHRKLILREHAHRKHHIPMDNRHLPFAAKYKPPRERTHNDSHIAPRYSIRSESERIVLGLAAIYDDKRARGEL